MPSEATTGLKIPAGQIGGITIANGKQADIDIDFSACTSVVQAGKSNNFNLKPTLRAAELGTNPLNVQGQVVAATAGMGTVSPSATVVPNANVWLEQQPTNTADAVVQTTQADGSGRFAFCAIGAGTYQIVADAAAMPSSGLPSDATIATGVSVDGSGNGPTNLQIPLVAEPSLGAKSPLWAQLVGEVTTVNSTAPGDDVSVGGVQTVGEGNSAVQGIVPVLPTLAFPATAGDGNTFPNPPVVTTGSTAQNCKALGGSNKCPAGANCECFDLAVPGGNPVTGAANTSGTGYNPPAGGAGGYQVSGVATAIGTTTSVCNPSSILTGSFSAASGSVATAPALDFAGCD